MSTHPDGSPTADHRATIDRIVRAIPDSVTGYGIITLDDRGVITTWNPGAELILGWSATEAIGQPGAMIFTPEDRAAGAPAAEMETARRTGQAIDERWHLRRDGSRFFAMGELMPLADGGAPFGFVKVLRDRTDRRILTAALRTSEERLNHLTDLSPSIIWYGDTDGAIRFLNRQWYDYTGQQLGANVPSDWEIAVHHDDLPELERQWTHARAAVSTFTAEIRLRRFDGAFRWFAVRAEPALDDLGTVSGWFGSNLDIHDRRTAEEALRESEDHYRHTVELNPQVAWTSHPDGQLDQVSNRWFDWTGTTGLGSTWADAIHPDDLDRSFAVWAAARASGRPYDIEHRIRMRSGEYSWMHSRAYPRRDAAGTVIKWYGTTEDVHERKTAEEAERRARSDLDAERHALEILNGTGARVAAELDVDRVVQIVVEAGVELIGAEFGAFFYNVEADNGERMMLYALAGADRAAFEQFGMPRHTEVFGPTFRGECVIRSDDITLDPRYGHNAPHAGMPAGHLPVRSYLAVPVAARNGEAIGGLLFGHQRSAVFDERAERIVAGVAAQAAIAIDNARLYQAAQREIGFRQRAEDELRRLNETLERRVDNALTERKLLADVFDDTDAIICVVDSEYVWRAMNKAYVEQFVRLYGYRPRLGTSLLDLLADRPEVVAVVKQIWDRALAGESFTLIVELGAEGREKTPHELRYGPLRDRAGALVGAVQFAQDISERVEREVRLAGAEEALRQSQKMEAVGQLTGGIAHDFNNLLTGVIGSLDLLKRKLGAGKIDQLERHADVALASANRAAALTHRLLAFSRRQPLDPRAVAADALVRGMEELLRRTLGERIALDFSLEPALWPTLCDPHQLENAVLNLAINARDAMPDGGSLTIEACNTQLGEDDVHGHAGLEPGDYICVAVSDTGTGMPPDVISRAFEPFFSTKPIGQGTGLGLSMIYGFAQQSGGHLRIRSEVDAGTTVSIYLPRHHAAPEPGDGAADDRDAPRAHAGEVVLVVEDEAAVRALVVEVLSELGYATLEAEDGPGGLKILISDARIDLLVTDVGLPGINGRQLADAARDRRPGLKILFMTGYAGEPTAPGGFLAEGMELITKPFAVDVLAQRARSMLEGR
ncbi:MAG TPA: PAS domain S-box protein [Sphingomonas sp.]|nr:PAS domain S-box protein [Sphingomonas sp.]